MLRLWQDHLVLHLVCRDFHTWGNYPFDALGGEVDLLQELLCEADLVLVDLLGCELGEHASEVALEGVLGDLDDGAAVPTEESLDGVAEDKENQATTTWSEAASMLLARW